MNYIKKIKRRVRETAKATWLGLKAWMVDGTYWVDYGFLQLPIHKSKDKQELLYHLYGAEWWQKEKDILAPLVGPSAVALDVGANVGFLTALLSKLVGSEGKVHSFEPSPTTHKKLLSLVEKNRLYNVVTHNVGCAQQESELRLNLMESSGNSSLRDSGESRGKIKEVEVVKVVVLDDYLDGQLGRLDLIKIDTEGFEDQVLAGARKLLRRFKPVVYVELSAEFRDSSERAVSILKEEGYTFEVEPDFNLAHAGDNFLAQPPKLPAV
jgi:FkbM family methyltransferase